MNTNNAIPPDDSMHDWESPTPQFGHPGAHPAIYLKDLTTWTEALITIFRRLVDDEAFVPAHRQVWELGNALLIQYHIVTNPDHMQMRKLSHAMLLEVLLHEPTAVMRALLALRFELERFDPVVAALFAPEEE